MKAAGVEWACICWAKPHFIIYTCRGRTIRYYGAGFHPILIAPHFYGAYITKLPTLYKVNCILKVLLATLPLTYLYHAIILLLCTLHGTAFFNGIANRLF